MGLPTIGFIGLGEMGGPMARNLLRAGYSVIGFDIDSGRQMELVAAGITAAADIPDLVRRCDVIATSLPSSSSWVETTTDHILPVARPGQILIDFGTVVPTQTRRLAALLAERGVHTIDAPVSGGKQGAENARLYIFVGGDETAVKECLPILNVIGGKDHLTYCGQAGNGQVVKGVNQLMMGLVSAAYLEAISFGVNAGVPAEVIHDAVSGDGVFRSDFRRFAERVVRNAGSDVGVKFRELPYFLEAAADEGFALPITKTVREFCEQGEYIVIDDHRQAPSYWHELLKSNNRPGGNARASEPEQSATGAYR
jgi:3-hydroxyisobutyrate dehydrogenase-like beta-hydroxyacid dehydrogenase